MTEIASNKITYSTRADNSTYYRLIALWVLNEAMFGGIIHGLKIPVSGLVVGSCAVICICLIAWYVPMRGAIIKATVIVAIFKMMLSPQAPPTAYIAVFFQGLLGEFLFRNRSFFKLACMSLGVLALVESGFQRILVATIIYGNDLWRAINDFLNGLLQQKSVTNYSLLIGSAYVLLHLVTGLFVGWWSSQLPAKIEKWSMAEENKIVLKSASGGNFSFAPKTKRRLRTGLFSVWVLLLLLYVQSYFRIGRPLLPSHISLKILMRSMIIALSWYFVVGPLLKQWLHSWLQKKQSGSAQDIQQVLGLLPSTQQIIVDAWRQSSDINGWKRIVACTKKILVNSLNPVVAGRIFILTGPIQSGKTTSLVKWSEDKDDVFGIFTPVVNGKRMFMNAEARHLFDMEARPGDHDRLIVGKYVFSKENFDRAIQIIRNARHKTGWIVLDEIGPMELRGEGFREVLKEIIAWGNDQQKIILVVRQGLAEQIKHSFQIPDAIVVCRVSDLV